MNFITFDNEKCNLCGTCVDICPFGALRMGKKGIEVNENCRMCKLCARNCPEKAIDFEQQSNAFNKDEWKNFLIFVEQEDGKIHPVAIELIGEARKMAAKVGQQVNCCMVGGPGTVGNAEKLLAYGVDTVYVYEHPAFAAFHVDSYADAVSDCISEVKPMSVLIGGTTLGRSLAPRLSARFHTGLTADCTKLDIKPNTDLIQIRPAFGGNVMAQILISRSRPQFATVRYRVMDEAKPVAHPHGKVVMCDVSDDMVHSRIEVLSVKPVEKSEAIEEEDVLIAVGRGVTGGDMIDQCRQLAQALGGQLAFTRPMVEQGYGDTAHQIGLSGRTVRPKLIITVGVSGAIQFTTCMSAADCIVAINDDPDARIFDVAHYCIVDDLNRVVPQLLKRAKEREA